MSMYKFVERKVEAKGKGILVTYQVFMKRDLNRNIMQKAIIATQKKNICKYIIEKYYYIIEKNKIKGI